MHANYIVYTICWIHTTVEENVFRTTTTTLPERRKNHKKKCTRVTYIYYMDTYGRRECLSNAAADDDDAPKRSSRRGGGGESIQIGNRSSADLDDDAPRVVRVVRRVSNSTFVTQG